MINGLICLKGGDMQAETAQFKNIVEITDISTWFEEEWFVGKQLVYVPIVK